MIINPYIFAGSTLLNGLISYYKAESSANDSLSLNNGTAQGGLVYASGKSGDGFKFNGTNAYVSLPNNSLQITTDGAISVWVYHTASGAQNIIDNTAYQTTPSNIYKGWALQIDNLSATTNKVVFIIPKGTSSTYTGWEFTTTSLTQNAWNHILIQRVGGVNTYCWINNISQSYTLRGTGADITANPIYHTTQYVNIGASKTLAGVVSTYMKANSLIDECGIWGRQLTTLERTDLYNSGAGKFYPTFN